MRVETIELRREVPAEEFIRGFVDVPRYFECCSYCPGFGKTWACPPYDFDPLDIWQRYKAVLLCGKKLLIPEEEREKTYSQEELGRVAYSLFEEARHELLSELFALEKENEGSLALSAGGCSFCEKCSRQEGLPCRKPEKLRYSVESLGGDVSGALGEYFSQELVWAKEGHLPEYFVLLGALLLP